MAGFNIADVPEDLSSLSDSALNDLFTSVQTHARELLSADDTPAETLTQVRDTHQRVSTERTARIDARAALSSDLEATTTEDPPGDDTDPSADSGTDDPPADPPAADPPPANESAVTASTGTPGVATIGAVIEAPTNTPAERHVSMVAAADVPAFSSGAELSSFAEASSAVESRLQHYAVPANRKSRVKLPKEVQASHLDFQRSPVSGGTRFGFSRNHGRHGAVRFKRDFPENLRITEGSNALSVLDYAASEKRLPGGSLAKSAEKAVAEGRSLTAAVGWCAPSEVIYDLCELETLDGILDLPEVQASRGGFQIPMDGGPDFTTIWDGIGNAGDVIISEYDVESGTEKLCFEIPCPDFEDVRLDVAYACVTGGLLQRRGYPEVVSRFTRGAMVALAHKINESVIARIEAASTGPTVIPQLATGDDAASALLSAVELAIEDTKYRNRMSFGSTLEVVLPRWVIVPIRAALARRKGVAAINISDAEILAAFTTRKAVPRFVYDWQDAFSGLVGGPGGASPLTEMPDTVDFLVYPAGTWTKAVQDVINLDTIFDKAQLTQNEFTAIFAEDGFNVLQMCTDSRVYTATVDPSGIVGCCSGGVS